MAGRKRIVIDTVDGLVEATVLDLRRGGVKVVNMDRVYFWNLPGILDRKDHKDQAIDYNGIVSNTEELLAGPENELVARFGRYMVPHITPTLKDGRVIITHPTNDGTVYVIQFEPSMRTISESITGYTVKNDQLVDGPVRDRRLAMPYIYLVMHLKDDGDLVENMSVFCGYQPMENLDHKLYMLMLPNIFPARQEVCLMKEKIAKKFQGPDPARGLGYIIDFWAYAFWHNIFNVSVKDAHFITHVGRRGHPGSFAEWESASKRDDRYGLGVRYFGVDKEGSKCAHEDTCLTIGDVLKVTYILDGDSLVRVLRQLLAPTTKEEKK